MPSTPGPRWPPTTPACATSRKPEKEAAALAASPACQKELRERADRERRDKDLLAQAPIALGLSRPLADSVTPAQVAAALKVPELKARAAGSDPEESLSAQRILSTYSGQTLFYLPQSLIEKQEYDRAIFLMKVGAEVRPDNPDVWVLIASTQARKGKAGREKALEALHTAVDKGLSDPAELDREDLRRPAPGRGVPAHPGAGDRATPRGETVYSQMIGEVQAQVAKQTVLASDPHAMGHELEPPPAASRRPASPRDRNVSRLSSSFL